MADAPFRTKTESKPEVSPKGKEPTRTGDESPAVEVPYLGYETEHGHPYSVDHFELGKYWNEGTGGFEKEVGLIEEYFKSLIDSGEIANDIDTVKNELKKMEKLTGVKDEARAVVKIETIAAHVKFLKETKTIKHNMGKYANN